MKSNTDGRCELILHADESLNLDVFISAVWKVQGIVTGLSIWVSVFL